MTDHDFERRLQRVMRADAERAVRPIDPVELALEAAGAPVTRRPLEWRPAGWPAIRLLLIAALLLLAAVAALLLIGGGRPRPAIVEVAPSPSAAASAPAASGQLLAELSGPWLADRPTTLSLGPGADTDRMALFVDGAGVSVFITPEDGSTELLTALTGMEGGDLVRLISRSQGDAVESDGIPLRGCTTGESGTYRLTRSADGLRLTLDAVDDPCPSRSLVYARTWTRWLGLPNAGGAGVVDAFDPLFTVELPPGGYTTDRAADHLTIVQVVPELQFLAWKDPQGWNDPCDLAKGRYPIEPGADAFVAYLRQLEGFTVDSTSELEVDGHRAVRIEFHANPDVACPQPFEFVTRTEPGTRTWFLRPGDTDSLIVVDLDDDTTLMFEVLPAPNPLEDQVIGSIRFLDQLPGAP